MGTQKRLTQAEWATLEKRLMAGESARSLAREYGNTEAAIRHRFGQVKKIKINDAAVKLVEARQAIESLPPTLRPQVNALADTLQQISEMAARSAELAARTAYRMSHIANVQASKLDEENPDVETARMVAGFTDTANKAFHQPMELMKAHKSIMDDAQAEDDPILSIPAPVYKIVQG